MFCTFLSQRQQQRNIQQRTKQLRNTLSCLSVCLSVLYCNVIRLCSCVGLSVSQLQRRECVPYVDLYRVQINHHVNYVQSKLSWEKQVMIAAQSHNVHRLLSWLIFWLNYIQTSDFRGSCSYYTVLTLVVKFVNSSVQMLTDFPNTFLHLINIGFLKAIGVKPR